MTWDKVQGDVDNSLWFEAYSHTLQRVREAVHGQQWKRLKGKVWEVKVSPLVRMFWEATGVELATSCTRLCWELPLRGVYRRRERGTISHVITFLDDLAVHVLMLDTWNQFIWPPSAAVPRATTEVEQYGYHCRNAMDLGTVMPVMELRATDEEGTYLCVVWASSLKEASWRIMPPGTRRSGSSPAGSPMTSAGQRRGWLVNFVPHIPQEADHVTELEAYRLLGWADDSPLEEDDEQIQEEEDEPERDEHEEAEEWEEENPLTWKSKGRQG